MGDIGDEVAPNGFQVSQGRDVVHDDHGADLLVSSVQQGRAVGLEGVSLPSAQNHFALGDPVRCEGLLHEFLQ